MFSEEEKNRMINFLRNPHKIELHFDKADVPPELIGLMGMDGEFHGDDEISVWPDRIVKSGRATIVFWDDGTKTVVKRSPDEPDNDYNAFVAALGIKIFGSNSQLKKVIKEQTVVQKPKKAKDACPIDKTCKAERSTMEHELGCLNELARKQYEEFQKQNTAKDEWICPKCGKHYQWQHNAEGRYAFCPSCHIAQKNKR